MRGINTIRPWEYVCLNCGAELEQRIGSRRIIYCNEKCKNRYYYTTTAVEREKTREILKTVKATSPHKETYICNYCGAEFEDYKRKNRKYCTRLCSDLAHSYEGDTRRVKNVSTQIPARAEMKEKALRFYAEGMTPYAISQELQCSNGTIVAWIKNMHQREEKPDKAHENTEPYFRYIYANNADMWKKVLRDEMKESGSVYQGIITRGKPVRLICGTMNINKGADGLATIIGEKLKLDIYDGGYFAFCGNGRENMRYIRWDGSGLQLTKRRRERGRYVWPPARFGMMVNVTAHEFEFILRGSNA